jgi:SRSO17 transposase
VLDDTGDRKKGSHTRHVGRQYLGSVGKVDNGIVAVSSLWADARVYYPLHVVPFTPRRWFPKGDRGPAYRTKPQLAVQLVDAARTAGVRFRAVVADCGYGEGSALEEALWKADMPFVLAMRPSKGTWAPMQDSHTPEEAARSAATQWAADLRLGGYGPDRRVRLVVATTDPATLPAVSTWYLATNLPHPDSPYATEDRPAPADLAEVVRLYGLRNWVEQGYKQVKDELGWADFMVRSDRAIRRHWTLLCCAFSFCWRTWFHDPPASDPPVAPVRTDPAAGRGEKMRRSPPTSTPVLAGGAAPGARLAGSLDFPPALLASVVGARATTTRPAVAAQRRRRRSSALLISPGVTK